MAATVFVISLLGGVLMAAVLHAWQSGGAIVMPQDIATGPGRSMAPI